MVKRFHAIITGRVQGVFFRATAREKAMELHLKGFVRNLPNGSVELEAQGDEGLLSTLLLWCQHGPPGARVDDVQIEWLSPKETESDFRIADESLP